MDEKKRIAAAIRDYLARERLSREQFAFKTKLGKSTVDKLLIGLFSDKTLAIVESHTKLVLRAPAQHLQHDAAAARSQELAASSLERLSIAVLPFADLSPEGGQQYLADGVVEDLTTALSRVPRVVVIARNASFLYRNRAADVRQIGRELGVRYLLEGSVRRAGTRLRIAGQLIDASSGANLWGDHYDGEVADIFELQDRVTASVVAAIAPHVLAAELERTRSKRPENLDAHDLYLRALAALREMTRDGTERAIALGEHALRLDPGYAVAAALVAFAYARRLAHQWWADLAAEEKRGVALARTALEHGRDDPEVLAMAGYALACLGDAHEEGLDLLDRSIALNPNSAIALAQAGWVRCYLGQAADAIGDFERALRLSPGEATRFRMRAGLAYAHLLLGEFEGAVTWGRRAVLSNPNFALSYPPLACALAHLGRIDEAREVADQLRALVPDFMPVVEERLFQRSGKLPLILSGFERAGLSVLPQQIQYCVSRDGTQIAYAISGHGPPIVKAANFMSHLQHDRESPIARHWVNGLSAQNRLIRYDQRGNGLSDRNAEDLSFESMVADLEAVADAAGAERFALLGISQGCSYSIAYALRHPMRVSHLILYGGYARGARVRGDPRAIAQRSAMTTLIREGWGQDNPAFRQMFASLFVPGATREQMQSFNALQRDSVAPDTAARLYDMFGGVDVSAGLAKVTVPTLVLHARDDAVVPQQEGRALAAGIPNARFVLLDSINHILLAHEPAFAHFLEEVRNFVGKGD